MKCVKEFLKNHWDSRSMLLLGYSGGPDSKALLYSLLEAGCQKIHVAHVDHGWRPESAAEAQQIREEISSLGLKFSLKTLTYQPEQNKESLARLMRLDFFSSLFQEGGYQALVLGHQMDDLAETSLKRLFEGAHLSFLGGMQKVSFHQAMPIWRPMLSTRKQELIEYLSALGKNFIVDPTNFSKDYLRSRMRVETLSLLEQSFGKNFVDNLSHLSTRSFELHDYLSKKIESATVLENQIGSFVQASPFERLEARFLLQKISRKLGVVIPREMLESILDQVFTNQSFKEFYLQSFLITPVRGWVVLLKNQKLTPKTKIDILSLIK